MSDSENHDWCNRETWVAAAGITSDPEGLQHVQELAQRAVAGQQTAYAPQWLLADWLREWVEQNELHGSSQLYSGLVRAALARVDWYQVAEHVLGEHVYGTASDPVLPGLDLGNAALGGTPHDAFAASDTFGSMFRQGPLAR